MNRRGSTTVEAAMVLPLVILAVVAVVLMMTYLLRETAGIAQVQISANDRAGEETKTILTYANVPDSIHPAAGHRGVTKCQWASVATGMNAFGILRGTSSARERSAYQIDERHYIRMVDFVGHE